MTRNRERLMDLFRMEDEHYEMLMEYRDARKIYLFRRREGRAILMFALFLYAVAGFTVSPYTLAIAITTMALGWVHGNVYSEVLDKHMNAGRRVLGIRKDIDLKRMIVEKDQVHDFLPHGLVHLRKKIEDVKKEIKSLG